MASGCLRGRGTMSNPADASELDEGARADGRRLIRQLGRSLVCLGGTCIEPGLPGDGERFFCATLFAMSFDGVPLLLTAGHVLKDLETLFRTRRVTACKLADFFGPGPMTRM